MSCTQYNTEDREYDLTNQLYSLLMDHVVSEEAADEMMDYTHPWFHGDVYAIADYIVDTIPEDMLSPYVNSMYMVYSLDLAADYTHTFSGATLPGMVGAFYAMYSNYPNLSQHKVDAMLYIIYSSCTDGECVRASRSLDMTEDLVVELHEMVCSEEGEKIYTISEVDVLEYCNKVLLHVHNAQISPFSEVWDDHYYLEGNNCLTTWLPKEMVDDVLQLTGTCGVETRLVVTH